MNRLLMGIALAALAVMALAPNSRAQTASGPKVLLTWRAQVYVPADYKGRVLPTGGSNIYASVEVIDNGRLVNLSGQEIFWYMNDEFIEGGGNRQTVLFTLPDRTGTNVDLRVQIPNYKGGVLKTVTIPVVVPQVVVEAPFPGNLVNTTAFDLQALPYFFNVQNLSALLFSWKVNGESPSTNDKPQSLHVDFAAQARPDARFDVQVSVTNPRAKFFEAGGDNVSLLFNQ